MLAHSLSTLVAGGEGGRACRGAPAPPATSRASASRVEHAIELRREALEAAAGATRPRAEIPRRPPPQLTGSLHRGRTRSRATCRGAGPEVSRMRSTTIPCVPARCPSSPTVVSGRATPTSRAGVEQLARLGAAHRRPATAAPRHELGGVAHACIWSYQLGRARTGSWRASTASGASAASPRPRRCSGGSP